MGVGVQTTDVLEENIHKWQKHVSQGHGTIRRPGREQCQQCNSKLTRKVNVALILRRENTRGLRKRTREVVFLATLLWRIFSSSLLGEKCLKKRLATEVHQEERPLLSLYETFSITSTSVVCGKGGRGGGGKIPVGWGEEKKK